MEGRPDVEFVVPGEGGCVRAGERGGLCAGRVCRTFCWVVGVRRSQTKRRVSLISIAIAAKQ